MSTIAPQDPVIVERTRDAWQRYADELRDLSGAEYEAAERDAWERLQEALADAHAEAALGPLAGRRRTSGGRAFPWRRALG